jgi:hypothetical protein
MKAEPIEIMLDKTRARDFQAEGDEVQGRAVSRFSASLTWVAKVA